MKATWVRTSNRRDNFITRPMKKETMRLSSLGLLCLFVLLACNKTPELPQTSDNLEEDTAQIADDLGTIDFDDDVAELDTLADELDVSDI